MSSSMVTAFPSRDELLKRGTRQAAIDELYDLWKEAHGEAMKLATRLPEVFGDPPRPRITLHVARGYDDEWELADARVEELSAQDPERHWTEVDYAATQHFQEHFNFSDAAGWHFYLPAFIRHYLADFPLSHWDAVVWACRSRDRFEFFTPKQIEFVNEFLALCEAWED